MAKTDLREANITLSVKGRQMAGITDPKTLGKAGVRIATNMYDPVTVATARAFDLLQQMGNEKKTNQNPKRYFYQRFNASQHYRSLHKQFVALFYATPFLLDLDARHQYEGVSSSYNLLHLAAEQGLDDIIEILIKAGGNINSVSNQGTPLAVAIGHGNAHTAELLLRLGADACLCEASAEEKQVFGITEKRHPIINAASANGGERIIPLLCQRGADPNIMDGVWTDTPIYTTYFFSRDAVAKALLDYGANPNLTRLHREPVIWRAAYAGTPEYLTLLFDAGADLSQKSFGRNAVEEAKSDNGGSRAPDKRQRLKLFEDRYKEATDCWERLSNALNTPDTAVAAINSLTARDVVLCSNIGKLDDLLSHPAWPECRGKMPALLAELPAWMTDHVFQRHTELFSAAPAQDQRWVDRVSASNMLAPRGATR